MPNTMIACRYFHLYLATVGFYLLYRAIYNGYYAVLTSRNNALSILRSAFCKIPLPCTQYRRGQHLQGFDLKWDKDVGLGELGLGDVVRGTLDV